MSTQTVFDVKTLDDNLNQAILSGKAMEAFEELYADDVVMQENSEPPIEGKAANRQREIDFFSSIAEWHRGALLGSAVEGNRSYAEWEMEVSFKNGARVRLSQVAAREWNNGKVVRERFYYSK